MPGRLRKLLSARKARWESLCKRCGTCCYERRLVKGVLVVNKNAPCEYLDINTNLCRVYENRFLICGACKKLTCFHARFSRYLPEKCGYVENYRRKENQRRN